MRAIYSAGHGRNVSTVRSVQFSTVKRRTGDFQFMIVVIA